jgi:hypothetical protein
MAPSVFLLTVQKPSLQQWGFQSSCMDCLLLGIQLLLRLFAAAMQSTTPVLKSALTFLTAAWVSTASGPLALQQAVGTGSHGLA